MKTLLDDQTKGVSSVIGGFLIHLILGTFYTLGNVNTYLTSYLRNRIDPELTYASSIWINAAFLLGQGTLMMVGGILENKIGPRLTCFIGSMIFSVSVGLTYFTIDYGFIWVVLTYGFLSSLGVGMAYVAPLAAGMKWFTKQKGLVNGVIVAGYGLGSLIFTYVQTSYLNPDNLSPKSDGYFYDETILERVPKLFILLFAIYITIQLIGCCLIFTPPKQPNEIIFEEGRFLLINSLEEETTFKDSFNDQSNNGYSSCEDQDNIIPRGPSKIDISYKQAIKTKEFFLLWLMFAFSTQAVQFINTMYKAYGSLFILDDHFLAFVGSIASIFNALGRLAWGYYYDKTSFRTCIKTLSGLLSILMFTFELSSVYESKTMFFIWVISIFFTFSGIFVIFPTATAQVFGRLHAGTIYGFLFTAPASISLCGAFLIQIILKNFGWFGSFTMISIFSSLGDRF
ncbi:putative MFS-type transporter YhjX [Sarcoptes scabiei]|uniref:Putative MFS-type transporter YhjX n=1 Tax=Sarcoptes scabiei TaxID=52283 RepID=A0A834VBC7_SARSC|nr:putative MFS-type transporter YhjX [Sarcoptes scabiei]